MNICVTCRMFLRYIFYNEIFTKKFMDLLAEIWLNGTVKNSVNYFYKIYRFIIGVVFHSTNWDADLLLLICIV